MKLKILYCSSACNNMQQEISRSLISMLRTMPVEVNLFDAKPSLSYVSYDLAIAYNKQGYCDFKRLDTVQNFV